MKATIRIIALLMIMLYCFAGCKVREYIVQKEITTDTLQVDKYDTIKINADSALLALYFMCDSNNNVLMKEIEMGKGARAEVRYEYRDNYIYITAYCDSLEEVIYSKDMIIKELVTDTKMPIVIQKGASKKIVAIVLIIGMIIGLIIGKYIFVRK